MSSNRWRRFAFFDRTNVILPKDIIQELQLPSTKTKLNDSITNESTTTTTTTTTTTGNENNDYSFTISCCSNKTITRKEVDNETKKNITLPKSVVNVSALVQSTCGFPTNQTLSSVQSTTTMDANDNNTTINTTHPFVYMFLSSKYTYKIYCFNVSSKCNTIDNDDEEYSGYFIPFPTEKKEDKIIQEHMYGEQEGGRIVGMASIGNADDDLYIGVITDDVTTCGVIVYKNPHNYLLDGNAICYKPNKPLGEETIGKACAITILAGYVAVGTDKGHVMVHTYPTTSSKSNKLQQWMEIPPPPCNQNVYITNVLLSNQDDKILLYVTYSKKVMESSSTMKPQTMGVCCFNLGKKTSKSSSPLNRFDLDGRDVPYSSTSDIDRGTGNLVVSKSDGLYFYTPSKPSGVAPIDGIDKLVMCCVPSFDADPEHHTISSYACVTSKDDKSGRDAVDVYDVNHKLVAFHVLLSPGYRALVARGVTTASVDKGRASAAIFTSGGSIVLLTEKSTQEKVSLLLQKNLYTAAISLAYADPYYNRESISILYRKHAEFLYRTNEYSAAMDTYIHTIGIVEPSHVIYRYLDAPKIPFLVKYLEALKAKNMALDSHLQLLHACHMKLNDVEAADHIQEEIDWRNGRLSSDVLSSDHVVIASLPHHDPLEAFKAISTMEAPQAVQALKLHGCTLARALPRETAGIVISLCDGTYSPNNLAAAAAKTIPNSDQSINMQRSCEKYPVHLFISGFLENPKLLRLILAHCYRNKCVLEPNLRRTLLELTLQEWKEAKNAIINTNLNIQSPSDIEKLRASEAMTILADNQQSSEETKMGDYESLVIVQTIGFTQGEIFLYEKLQMPNMLLERYAKDGSERARRQMIAMCRMDPELLADVLSYFVLLASNNDLVEYEEKCEDTATTTTSERSDLILEDIQEVLEMAKGQGVLSPVRIARILAGENGNPFSSSHDDSQNADTKSVPLLVALDYVGGILDDASKKITRLKSEIDEFNQSCNAMEMEIQSLLHPTKSTDETPSSNALSHVNIEQMYELLQEENGNTIVSNDLVTEQEEFWREMGQSDDRFETITRFFGKGYIL